MRTSPSEHCADSKNGHEAAEVNRFRDSRVIERIRGVGPESVFRVQEPFDPQNPLPVFSTKLRHESSGGTEDSNPNGASS